VRAGEVEIVARADELEHGRVPKIGREVDNITAGVHSGFRWAGEDGGAEVGGFGAVVADALLADTPLGGLLVVQEGAHSAELRADAHRLARGRCDKCFELLPACVRWLQRNLMLPQRRWPGTPKRGFGKENCSAALLRADAPVPHRLHCFDQMASPRPLQAGDEHKGLLEVLQCITRVDCTRNSPAVQERVHELASHQDYLVLVCEG
jgi:hypothetical protein